MKRLLALILSLVFALLPVAAVNAQGTNPETETRTTASDCFTDSIGDINSNGTIDSMDYVLLKRAYFGTYLLKELTTGDVNTNGRLDSMDYVLLKRAYFGTYAFAKAEIQPIYNLFQLRDFLNDSKNNGELNVKFEYLGSDPISAQLIARMTSSFYISYCYVGNQYNLDMYEYPGDRVAKAYHSGDTSALSYDEKLLLEEATKIVEQAKAATDNDFDLEVYLHDYVVEAITYYSPSTDVPDPMDPPRHLTAVGGLLDKSANCQGYTDAFNLLASMAGFEVGRLSVFTIDDDTPHVTSTISLEGEWYIVDPTFNDVLYDTGEQKTNYRLFNAGKDRCAEYYWPAEFEYNQIAETCKDQYFYNHRGTRFDSLKSISEHITANWLMGQTEFDVMLSGQVCSWGDLSDVLYDDLMLTNKQFNYHIWCYHTSKDTFFKVVFY